jgi:hypothetical protein
MLKLIRGSALLLALWGASSGCGSGSFACPRTEVVLDAGIDGLPDVGENVAHTLCLEVCGENNYSCTRTKELVVTCTPYCK